MAHEMHDLRCMMRWRWHASSTRTENAFHAALETHAHAQKVSSEIARMILMQVCQTASQAVCATTFLDFEFLQACVVDV